MIATLTYGAQSWSLTKIQTGILMKTEKRMLRSISKIKLKHKINNLTLLNKFNHKGIRYLVKKLKFNYAGHLIRDSKFKWTEHTLDWVPYDHRRSRGRPSSRWRDEIAANTVLACGKDALHRKRWDIYRVADTYVQRWAIWLSSITFIHLNIKL